MLAQFLNPDLCSQQIVNMEEVQLYFGVGGCHSLTRAAVAYLTYSHIRKEAVWDAYARPHRCRINMVYVNAYDWLRSHRSLSAISDRSVILNT
jgi:hypothetical protein